MRSSFIPPKKYYLNLEYCPGPFYMGWWLYAYPIETEDLPFFLADKREDYPVYTKYITIHETWRLDAVMAGLGLKPILGQITVSSRNRYIEAFMEKYPSGALVTIERDGREVTWLDCDHLWDYARIIEELRWQWLRDQEWKDKVAATFDPLTEALRACELQLCDRISLLHHAASGASPEMEAAWEQARDALKVYDEWRNGDAKSV